MNAGHGYAPAVARPSLLPIGDRLFVMSDAQFTRVDVSSWDVRDEETAGDDEKVWLTAPDGQDWLFKPVTEHKRLGFVQGEDWSEKVSSEIATLIGVPCAKVEVAVRGGRKGLISLDLTPPDWQLQPGSVLLAQTTQDYIPRDRTRRGHSLVNIERALEGFDPSPGATVPGGFKAFDVFTGFLVLDAWIANRDRHDENWAVLLPPPSDPTPGMLAGSYDHATSLGFNLQDDERDRRLQGGTVEAWAERGDAYRFEWPGGRKQDVPTLVDFAATATRMRQPTVRSYWTGQLEAVEGQAIADLVARVPGMSQLACRFVVELTSINRERLLNALA
jgi:hypothetical protein